MINGVDSLKLNGNGNSSIENYLIGNDDVEGSKNGANNGSVVTYINGDSVAPKVVAEGVSPFEVEIVATKKKTVEDIGQEEAWFKRGSRDQLEVIILLLFFIYQKLFILLSGFFCIYIRKPLH